MLKKIVIGLVVILVIVFGLAATKPDSYTVVRSASIKAPPEKIIAQINDFHNWSNWSPWEHLDPNMKRTYGGAANGKGAVYSWEGNKEVGAGRMEITDQAVPNKVDIKLDFLEPFKSSNTTVFALEPKGEMTTVTWTMSGPAPFITKLMMVFTSMDAMIGKDFEKGLTQLKATAEK